MRFWRRKELQEAKEALEQSERERSTVDRYVRALYARKKTNNFAPMIEQAFKAARGWDK